MSLGQVTFRDMEGFLLDSKQKVPNLSYLFIYFVYINIDVDELTGVD